MKQELHIPILVTDKAETGSEISQPIQAPNLRKRVNKNVDKYTSDLPLQCDSLTDFTENYDGNGNDDGCFDFVALDKPPCLISDVHNFIKMTTLSKLQLGELIEMMSASVVSNGGGRNPLSDDEFDDYQSGNFDARVAHDNDDILKMHPPPSPPTSSPTSPSSQKRPHEWLPQINQPTKQFSPTLPITSSLSIPSPSPITSSLSIPPPPPLKILPSLKKHDKKTQSPFGLIQPIPGEIIANDE